MLDQARASGTTPDPAAEAQALFEEAHRRARRRRQRRTRASLALVALGLAAVVVVSSGDGGGTRTDAGPPSATAPRAGTTTLLVQLLGHGEPLVTVNSRTGVVRRLHFPTTGGDWLQRLHYTDGRFVWATANGVYAVDASLKGRSQRLGPSGSFPSFFPAAEPGRIWLVAREGVIETTVSGKVIQRAAKHPCPGAIVGAVRQGLVCQRARRVMVVDPASGSRIASAPGAFPLGTHGSVLATCDDPCRTIHISDVTTGRRSAVVPPPGYRFLVGYDGAFSPDGRVLAVPATRRGTRSRQVVVVDVDRGTARVIQGSRLAADYRKMDWAPSGELFFAAPRGTLMRYRPGADRARLLPVKLGSPMLDLAAG